MHPKQTSEIGGPRRLLHLLQRTRFGVGLLCIFLGLLVWIDFAQTLHHDFVYYDDNHYVYDNPRIIQGLTAGGILSAFTRVHADNWHPLTTISHMLDCQIYGLHPWGHHLNNVLLHAAAAILLFLMLHRLTGALWPSVFVAALFAIHPLRVESVAWVSERKDLLSGVFFMLTLWAYGSYASKNGLRAYIFAIICFALGLMCKPTLVSVPFVLLLLDYWPLGRLHLASLAVSTSPAISGAAAGVKSWRDLVSEKLPFFALSAASCVVTLMAQKQAMVSTDAKMSLALRVFNAITSYAVYVQQLFYPSRLAVLYPHPAGNLSIARVTIAFFFLSAISVTVFLLRRKAPFALVGWLWFLGMLVPMIGLVQVGRQAHADRYTYLSHIGLYLLVSWAVTEFFARHNRSRQLIAATAAAVVLTVLAARTYAETAYWQNSEALWKHTIENTSNNGIAHICLADVFVQKGNLDEGIAEYHRALAIIPDFPEALGNLGNALLQKGELNEALNSYRKAFEADPNSAPTNNGLANALVQAGQVDEAVAHYRKALEIKPDYVEAYGNLGNVLVQKGQFDEAIHCYSKALEIKPEFAPAHSDLGNALLQKGQLNDAIDHYQKAIQIDPKYPQARFNLGNAFLQRGDPDDAIFQMEKALEIKPDYAEAHNNIGIALVQKGNLDQALRHFSEAVRINANYAEAHCNMGRALALLGWPDKAVEHLKEALRLKPDYTDARKQLHQLGVEK